MFAELIEAFTREPPVDERVTVLDAAGPTFCAGVDLSQRTEGGDTEGESPLEVLCAAVRNYPLPVLAVLQGSAIGGGAMLALHCDFVIAASEAKVGNSAVQLGLVPAWPVSRHILRIAGPPVAARLLMLGDLIPSEELARLGLIVSAVPGEELSRTSEVIVSRLARNAPLSLRAIKATLNADDTPHGAHHEVLTLIRAAQQSEDAREGVLARAQKRAPVYVGR
jgi:enoyl-CoA hydratase/carnithine racemase